MHRPVISELFSLLEQYGVRHVVCSPGSRNAAILQEANRNPQLKKIIVVDERSAAFIALGISTVERAPVGLICTSGSALLNYGPALAEAFYQGIPLIAISADRPDIWIDQDDSQTIRQPNALSNIVKNSYALDGDRRDEEYLWYSNRTLNEALNSSLSPKKGPVHINISLNGIVSEREGVTEYIARKINIIRPSQILETKVVTEYASLAASKKVMIVAGFMEPDNKLQKAVATLASLPNVCLMAETVSNLHLPSTDYMVDTVLFKLTQEQEKILAPEIVISLGGALISRKLKEFLRRNPPKYNWSFNYANNIIDCFKSLTEKFECSAPSFMQTLGKRMKILQKQISKDGIPDYKETWKRWRELSKRKFNTVPWSDLKALQIVLNSLPEETNLFLSNGTSVRYGQIIPYSVTHATFSNRGVSGIEGCTSTALGASLVYQGITCLITGDMSFAYDIGALTNGLASGRFKVIILDNEGGDIFRFIQATKNLDIRERYLCADREIPVEQLAYAYGWSYYYADSEKRLKDNLKDFFATTELPAILHIDTASCNNAEILGNFLKN